MSNFVTNGISLLRNKNNIGPKLKLCGAPQVILRKFEFSSRIFVYYGRLLK